MAQSGVVSWSTGANNNQTADPTINWSEGQSPGSINDSARAMMARTAEWRDDIMGTTVTTGTGTAYALASSQVFLSNANGYTIQFTPGLTNTGAVTLSVDSQTAAPLRFLSGVDLPSGVLISGSLYQATYRAASGEWLLHSSPLAQPFLVPLGGIIDYAGSSAPSSNFALPQGQDLDRTVYATLFSLIGTTYGSGSGSTFRIPDMVGRIAAMRDAGSARLSSTYFGANPATLGAAGGGESQTLTLLQTPGGITSANGAQGISVASAAGVFVPRSATSLIQDFPSTAGTGLRAQDQTTSSGVLNSSGSNSISVTATNTGASGNGTGAAAPHNVVQPTIILNKIMRIL